MKSESASKTRNDEQLERREILESLKLNLKKKINLILSFSLLYRLGSIGIGSSLRRKLIPMAMPLCILHVLYEQW